jgi:O-antigen biosynthesis protein
MLNGRTIFDEPHHQSLQLLAVEALAEGDAVAAFKLADRCCRISPLPEPHSHVLRAEASFTMGNRAAALSDLAKALLLDPEDIAANRRMLSWGKGASQECAALALVRREHNIQVLRQAIEVLRGYGQHNFANVIILDDLVEGWAAWEADAPLELTITDGIDHVTSLIEPDPAHPFRDVLRASNFRFLRPKSSKSQSILLSIARRVFYSTRVASNNYPRPRRREQPNTLKAEDRPVTVVVPVYDDYQTTQACLESLLSAVHRVAHHKVVLVDDASPNRRLSHYLATIANGQSIKLLKNDRNLGFVGSVNHALDHVVDGDIVLLNADTIVPLGFIDRLAAAARSAPNIGTVTPLSNNGDLVGFPVPNTANPLESFESVERIDKIAANVNAGRLVDIPNGIGFCLYVTRECLDTIGFLSENFHRGYLEDVDLCLRARARGFRNVCAPCTYVGHAGSKSFGAEKRSLVVRNLAVLERRFPRYRLEYGAYSLLDPLRPYRMAIERRAVPSLNHPRLLVTGGGIVGAVTRARACELVSRAQPVLILEVRYGPSGPIINIADAGGGVPQSIQFALRCVTDRTLLFDYLSKLRPSRVEILDPASVPPTLVDLLLDLRVPCDLFVADAGLFGGCCGQFSLSAIGSTERHTGKVATTAATINRSADRVLNQRWRDVVEAAERILVPCEHARALAMAFLPERQQSKIESTGARFLQGIKRPRKPTAPRLGLLSLRGNAEELWFMTQIACALRAIRPDVSLTIVGTTLDDVGLMRVGNTFVTGSVEPEEFQRVIDAYSLQSLFVSISRPIFGHPLLISCFTCSLQLAFFDWSMGRIKPKRGDLALNPHLSLKDVVAALCHWLRAA